MLEFFKSDFQRYFYIYKCPVENCCRSFNLERNMIIHQAEHCAISSTEMDESTDKFESGENIDANENKPNPFYICTICYKSFSVLKECNDHYNSHKYPATFEEIGHLKDTQTKNRDYRCYECNKIFKMPWRLTLHINDVHSNNVWKCHICDTVYTTKRALLFHNKKYH